jgi:cytochrome c oxidase cbb3-type subunit 3/ubiquinol-cytochrome c reductase cytochrome c subunit
MPGFEESLSGEQIDDLVVLIRSWARAVSTSQTPVGDVQIDYSEIVINPDGETPDFTLREGRYVPSVQVRDALADGQKIILLDARPTSDWLEERITGAVPVPFYDMDRLVAELPRDGTHVVAYCGCPHAASGRVVDRLRREGFENTSVLDEGVRHWIDEGYPSQSGQPSPRAPEADESAAPTAEASDD